MLKTKANLQNFNQSWKINTEETDENLNQAIMENEDDASSKQDMLENQDDFEEAILKMVLSGVKKQKDQLV